MKNWKKWFKAAGVRAIKTVAQSIPQDSALSRPMENC